MNMNSRLRWAAAIGAVAFATLGAGRSQAAVIYDGVGFLQGSQSFTDSFSVAAPGTLTVTLANVAWPQQLASLSLVMSSPTGVLGPLMGPGTATYDVLAGNLTAQWFGTAQGPLDTGVYSLQIQYSPNGGTSGNPVPLPTSIALFLSGLGLLIWQRRIRREPAQPLDEAINFPTA